MELFRRRKKNKTFLRTTGIYSKQHMSLRKPNLHYVPREISQSERILHCCNLFLLANEKWCTVELYQISISSDRVRSGYEIMLYHDYKITVIFMLSTLLQCCVVMVILKHTKVIIKLIVIFVGLLMGCRRLSVSHPSTPFCPTHLLLGIFKTTGTSLDNGGPSTNPQIWSN